MRTSTSEVLFSSLKCLQKIQMYYIILNNRVGEYIDG